MGGFRPFADASANSEVSQSPGKAGTRRDAEPQQPLTACLGRIRQEVVTGGYGAGLDHVAMDRLNPR
jgi:hypothetical protein